MVELKLNGAPISMKLDTEAGISIVSKNTYDQFSCGQKVSDRHYKPQQFT